MRFKFMITTIILTSICSANASDWVSYLKEDMARKMVTLGNKIEECRAKRDDFKFKPITNAWFNSLPRQEQKQVISFAYRHAGDRCSKAESSAFSEAVVKYVAQGGDPKAMKAWLGLNEITASSIESINSIGVNKVLEFVNKEFPAPFDGMDAVDYYKLE